MCAQRAKVKHFESVVTAGFVRLLLSHVFCFLTDLNLHQLIWSQGKNLPIISVSKEALK